MTDSAIPVTDRANVALLGCGRLCQRLAEQLPQDRYRCIGVRRSAMPQSALIEYRQGDLTDPEQLQRLLPEHLQFVVITTTPDEYSDSGYKQAYPDTVASILQSLDGRRDDGRSEPVRVIFVSSSSVYGQSAGEWVDETSVTEPSGYNGVRLLQAEQLLADSSLATTVVRFSGIYGASQRMIQQVADGQGSPSEPPLYSNRIHIDDCAAVLAHLIQLSLNGLSLNSLDQPQTQIDNLYLASDCKPAPLHEVKQWIAEQLGLPTDYLQATSNSSRGSKRCNNQRLLDSGFQFSYPSYQEGYRESIAAFLKQQR